MRHGSFTETLAHGGVANFLPSTGYGAVRGSIATREVSTMSPAPFHV
jgi:hypothetical protein